MTARVIDGRAIARAIEARIATDAADLRKRIGRSPKLVAVIVGDDAASKIYVRRKSEAAQRVGIDADTRFLPATAATKDVAAVLDGLATDGTVDGILLQLPLPDGLDASSLTELIPPEKDVDAFHPRNVGATQLGQGKLQPCTPQGILEILDHENVKLEGVHVVIVNHSHVVGRPLAMLLLERNATVTICHKFTKDLAVETRRADVLVTATGVAGLIGPEHVKPGAVVIDVGIARDKEGAVRGDVRFDAVKEVAGAITPVPGGVGPLTVALLLRNVVTACRMRRAGADRAEA